MKSNSFIIKLFRKESGVKILVEHHEIYNPSYSLAAREIAKLLRELKKNNLLEMQICYKEES